MTSQRSTHLAPPPSPPPGDPRPASPPGLLPPTPASPRCCCCCSGRYSPRRTHASTSHSRKRTRPSITVMRAARASRDSAASCLGGPGVGMQGERKRCEAGGQIHNNNSQKAILQPASLNLLALPPLLPLTSTPATPPLRSPPAAPAPPPAPPAAAPGPTAAAAHAWGGRRCEVPPQEAAVGE